MDPVTLIFLVVAIIVGLKLRSILGSNVMMMMIVARWMAMGRANQKIPNAGRSQRRI